MKSPENTNKNRFYFNFARLIGVICFVYIVFPPAPLLAKTVSEYRKNLRQARDLTFVLLYPEDEDTPLANSPKYERDVLTKIRKSVPAREKIEWQGGNIETDNQWLVSGLDEFEKQTADSPSREAILTAIGERLDALGQKIGELENLSAPNRAKKEEDKQKLAEILRREEYQKPEKGEESFSQKIYRQIQSIIQKIIDWLDSFFPRPDLSSASAGGFQTLSFVLQMLLYALVIGIIAFLIYKFAPPLAGRFGGKRKLSKNERVILGERLSAEETAQSLFEEAEKLAREGNPRGAIRKGYIALLCELADRKIIGLARNKTNRDYLRDVRGRSELYQNLNGLTANFERHWYGFTPAEEKDWEEFRNGYEKTIKN